MPSAQRFVSDNIELYSHRDFSTTTMSSGRPASAMDHVELRGTGKRPKSTPVHAIRHRRAPQSAQMSRPKTAAVILGRADCDRVQQLEQEPTRRHNLENHLPLKRAKPPPWQKNMETPLVPFVVGPGYILSRSKTKYHVTIKDEFFDPIFEENNKKKNQGDPERDNLISQLQQQISDLTLYLEEERLNHRQTKQKADEYLRDKIELMTSQHQEYIKDVENEHREEMEKQRKQMEVDNKESKSSLEKQISRMVKEIEFLQGAFESYKSSLHTETADKWNVRDEEMRQKHNTDKQQAIQELKSRLTGEFNKKMAEQKKNFQKQIDTVRKESKRDIDNLVRRFSNAAAEMEKLRRTTAELEECQAELAEVKDAYTGTCVKLTSTTHALTDAKVKLIEFEEKFQDRVTEVDDKYRNKLDQLMSQNTELKRIFVQKCGELFEEKKHSEKQTCEKITSVKETMESLIKSKTRVNMSIALGGVEIDKVSSHKTRPLSAPGTRREVVGAHVTAGETEPPRRHREFFAPDIDMNARPEIEELRAELLSTPVREISKEELLKSMSELKDV